MAMAASITANTSENTARNPPSSTSKCRSQTISMPIAEKPDTIRAAPIHQVERTAPTGGGTMGMVSATFAFRAAARFGIRRASV